MLLSFALIILTGFALKGIFEKLKLPGLLGMLIAGIVLGPQMLNLISPAMLQISGDLREIALIVILTRVGLSLDLKDLKQVGRPALLMCFLPATLLRIPVSILSGLAGGLIIGLILAKLFRVLHMRDTVKVLLILGLSFALMGLETIINQYLPFSGLLAVIAISGTLLKTYDILARRIKGKFSKIWVAAELMLFVLLGAVVDISQIKGAGLLIAVIVVVGLLFRSGGVLICLLKTNLNNKERLFCVLAYLPKATVQAAIGALPLAAGVSAGPIILTAAVMSIIISAPLGAIGMELTYRRLLEREK